MATAWTPRLMIAAVALSAAGMAFHTVREFGAAALLHVSSGFLPVVGVQLLLFAAWWTTPTRRRGLAVALAATGMVQLVGGAILTALPLPFLPFTPEASLGHYASHLVLGVTQVPLLLAPLLDRERRFKRSTP